MTITNKILDGFSSLLDKVRIGDEPLSHIDGDDLNRELEARVATKSKHAPGTHPIAKIVGPGNENRTQREVLAATREASIRAQRKQDSDRVRAERERELERLRKEARTTGSRPTTAHTAYQAGAGTGQRKRRSTVNPFVKHNTAVSKAYKTLDLPMGADFSAVKAAYRKLMRRYHPDVHAGSPKKQKAATELSVQVSQAYEILEKHLKT